MKKGILNFHILNEINTEYVQVQIRAINPYDIKV